MLDQPSLLFTVLAFILALGPLIFFHELGHYSVARMFGVGAETFSIGFGKSIAGWTDKRGTKWQIGWLPLGGFVKLAGDMDPTSQPDPDAAPDPSHFQNQPLWQKFLIVLAGPIANFLLAILIFSAFFMAFGRPTTPPILEAVQADTPAAAMGLRAGDEIRSVNGSAIDTFEDLSRYVLIRPDAAIDIRFERDGQAMRVEGRTGRHAQRDEFGQKQDIGFLGVVGTRGVERLGPLRALAAGAEATWELVVMIVEGLRQIIFGERSVRELGGPMKIAQVSGQQASLGIFPFIQLLAFLSINLGFINLLPVPMLDGGHLAFYSYEAVRRKPVGPRAQEWAYRIGLSLILALVLFTTLNDLASFGVGQRLERLIG